MSLQTAIQALTPALYWTLGEAAGSTTVADSAGGAWPGTVSGDVGLGAFGPETGTTAARMFATGLIQSAAWGSSVWNAFSVMFLASAPFAGTVGSFSPIAGLGDPASPTLKFRLGLQSSSNNAGSWQMQNSGGIAVTQSITTNWQGWHHFTFTWNPTGTVKQPYLDGVLGGSSVSGLLPVPAVGDRWWLQSATPVEIAHFAVFTRALTQVEIKTVSDQVLAWPGTVPINMPLSLGETTVDLTPVLTQTTQILNNQTVTDPIITTQIPAIVSTTNTINGTTNTINGKTTVIQTDTQNIVNTLFPQLATVLNDIGTQVNDVQDAVRGTVKQGADWLTKTVGELLSRGNTTDLNYASLSGGPTCSPIEVDVSGNHLYGIRLEITEYPPDWQFRTPDLAWSLKDLAVIRVYRGGKLEARQGVHTIVHTWEPIPQPGYPWLGIFPPVQTAGTVITVDFAPGVCGNLIGAEFPS